MKFFGKVKFFVVFISITMLFFLAPGGRDLLVITKAPTSTTAVQRPNTDQKLPIKEIFSCLQSEQKPNNLDPYKQESLVFIAKEGIDEKAVSNKLSVLKTELKFIKTFWGYTKPGNSTLFIRHHIERTKVQGELKTIVESYKEKGHFSLGISYGKTTVFYPEKLPDEKQQIINGHLEKLKQAGRVTGYSWTEIPKQLYGFLSSPEGMEDIYLQELYELNIFDCVSREYTTA